MIQVVVELVPQVVVEQLEMVQVVEEEVDIVMVK
jgi:hypothetical protein